MKKLIAGNWKMNGSLAMVAELTQAVVSKAQELDDVCDFLLCPPAVYIRDVTRFAQSSAVQVGGQDCSCEESGAYTGEVSAAMLRDTGCDYVILGHSERREHHKETSALVAAKAEQALRHNLTPIICIGESENERTRGKEKTVVGQQIDESLPAALSENIVIAYEPVWAIGTGKSATPDDIADMHQFIREKLQEKLADSAMIRILYGGSVKPGNATELFSVPDVDGALIGGASLKADQFLAIGAAVKD